MRLKVLHVVPTYYPATYWGGPIHSLYGLCNALSIAGDVEVKVLTSDSAGSNISERLNVETPCQQLPAGYEVCYCRRFLGHSISPGMLRRLPAMVRWADVVHLTGCIRSPRFRRWLCVRCRASRLCGRRAGHCNDGRARAKFCSRASGIRHATFWQGRERSSCTLPAARRPSKAGA